MKQHKRFWSLLLVICMVTSMLVPAVWAADPATYTYDFDYRSFKEDYLVNIKDDIAAEYDKAGSQQNWKLEEESNIVEGNANATYYRAHAGGYQSKSGIDLEYLRVYTNVDGYIALRVKTPAAGNYQVSLTYGRSKYGAANSTVYILDKDTTNIAEAIAGADASKIIGDVSYAHTAASTDPATKADTWLTPRETEAKPIMCNTTVGSWTADGQEEHILVFKATAKSESYDVAYMYPTALTLTSNGPIEEVKETVPYSFGSSDYKNKAFDAVVDDMAVKYADGTRAWTFESSSAALSNIKYSGSSMIQVNTYEPGDYIAFRIKVPEAGQYKATVNYGYRNMGGKAAFYILPASGSKFTPADITGTPVIEGVNFHSEHTSSQIDGVVTSENIFTSTGAKEYIAVFSVTEKTGHGSTATHETPNMAIMYLRGITLERVGDYVPVEKETVFNFDLLNQGLSGVSRNGLYDEKCRTQIKTCFEKGTLNWKYKDMSFTSQKSSDVVFDKPSGSFRGRAQVGDWIAFTIKSPGQGEVELTLKHQTTAYGVSKMNVYLLPLNTPSVEYALRDEYLLGTVNLYDPEQPLESPAPTELKETSLGKMTLGDAGGYILVFKAMEANAGGKSHIYFSQLTAKGATTDVEYVEPQEPEIPDEDVLEQTIGTVVAKNAIGSYTVRVMATDVVNGHDYVYVAMMGSMFFVYDLDEGKLVDYREDFQSTPRCIYVDKDGIVWVGGANGWLNRYDPVSKTAEKITINNITDLFPTITSFNCWGLTGDGNGNLYFATYNTSYMAKYDTKTGVFSRISAHLSEDAQYAGTGGVILKDGYAYLTIDGNKNSDSVTSHELIRFDLQKQEIVKRLDISKNLGGQQYLTYMYLVGDVLLGSTSAKLDANVAVDISGEEMKFIEVLGLTGIKGGVSEVIDGKAYFLDFDSQLQAYDVEKRTVTPAGIEAAIPVKATVGGIVSVEGDDRLPGQSILTFQSLANELNLLLYNPQTKETVTVHNITDYIGTGNQLRTVALSPDRKQIYVSAYGINQISVYDVESGKVVKQFGTVGHQAEGLIWYDGLVYGGHYGTDSTGMSVIDVETGTAKLLFAMDNSVFMQHRMHANTAGDGMVFYGCAPIKNVLGGVLCWYDIEADRIYVVAGPDPEDVFYTPSGNVSGTGWYSAVTGQLADFDDNNDGKDDAYIGEAQRFTGLIEKQSINCIIYKNGYIYGSTTRAGGSGADNTGVGNACLFVYDVKNMRLVGSCDISAAIDGLTSPIEFIDTIALDPDVEGKFWGVVSDTLFSYTVDLETGKFTVKEELSYGKALYNNGKNDWQSRDIIFDGDFMYVVFGSRGVYMVNREDPKVNYRISREIPKRMVLAADGNLYYTCNTNNLMVLKIAETAQSVKDPYEAADVQAMINALDAPADITLEDEIAIIAARKAYDRLSAKGKEAVDTTRLVAAEAAVKPLREAADKAAAEAVMAQIDAIGVVISLSDEGKVAAARNAYEALSAAQKALVTNLAVLEAAEASLDELRTPAVTPPTGDAMPITVLALVLLLCAAAVTGLAVSRKRIF